MMNQIEEPDPGHPFIGYLVKQLNDLDFTIQRLGDPNRGQYLLMKMQIVMGCLAPETQRTEKWKTLEAEMGDCQEKYSKALHKVRNFFPGDQAGQRETFDFKYHSDYIRWLRELKILIWEGGYLSDQLYKQAYPTAGDNISGEQDREAVPKILSSEVEE